MGDKFKPRQTRRPQLTNEDEDWRKRASRHPKEKRSKNHRNFQLDSDDYDDDDSFPQG